jgi:hypothetical protein
VVAEAAEAVVEAAALVWVVVVEAVAEHEWAVEVVELG